MTLQLNIEQGYSTCSHMSKGRAEYVRERADSDVKCVSTPTWTTCHIYVTAQYITASTMH